MKKKILIVGNNVAHWKTWPDKIEKLKEWFLPNVELEVSITHVHYQSIPFEPYNNDSTTLGVSRWWYSAYVASLGQGYDIILFVVPMNQWQGQRARGWRTFVEYGAVGTQIGVDENESFWEKLVKVFSPSDGEAFHQLARHELLHALFLIKCGEFVALDGPPVSGQCKDTTHYYWDRQDLRSALNEVTPPPQTLPPPDLPTVTILHHTGTPRDTTSLDAILLDHNKRYGRSFYQCFITADGTVHWQHKLLNNRTGAKSIDYCVVGDFTTEKPTEAQLDALSGILGKSAFLGHGDAVYLGASPSVCPGTLVKDLEDYRKVLRNLQSQIDTLAQMIKSLLGL